MPTKLLDNGVLGTVYTFRGPRSHRPVKITVPHAYWMRAREASALKKANEKFRRELPLAYC